MKNDGYKPSYVNAAFVVAAFVILALGPWMAFWEILGWL